MQASDYYPLMPKRALNKLLFKAIQNKNISLIEELIDGGADPNVQDDYGDTVLIYASGKGHIDTVRLLLEKGADPNVKKDGEDTALTIASEIGHLDIVRLLLEYGADPNIQDDYGYTALMNATMTGYIKTVKILLEAGANPFIKNIHEKDAYRLAKYSRIRNLIKIHMNAYSITPLVVHAYKSKSTKLPLEILREVHKKLGFGKKKKKSKKSKKKTRQ